MFRRTVSAIIIAMLLTSTLTLAFNIQPVKAGNFRVIDLYTQKVPFDGKGPNQPSDSFQPQELVILYALVTYNDAPVAQKVVSFSVNGPPNPFENITLLRTATSDQNGVANVSFRIPWLR